MTSTAETELRAAGLRVTTGRIALLEALDRLPHSDAAGLHRLLAHDGTSLQSVHNILGDLTDVGIIRRIEPAGSPARYERRAHDNHHHIVCTGCGAIADVDCVAGAAPCLHPANAAGFTVTTAEVTFWGLCPACAPSISLTDSSPTTIEEITR